MELKMMQPVCQRLPGVALPHGCEILLVEKAENLSLPLPPIRTELDRLRRLGTRLTERPNLSGTNRAEQHPTLADILQGNTTAEPTILKQAKSVETALDTQMTTGLRTWLDQAASVLNQSHVNDQTTGGTQCNTTMEEGVAEWVVKAVQDAQTGVEALIAVFKGEAGVESLRVVPCSNTTQGTGSGSLLNTAVTGLVKVVEEWRKEVGETPEAFRLGGGDNNNVANNNNNPQGGTTTKSPSIDPPDSVEDSDRSDASSDDGKSLKGANQILQAAKEMDFVGHGTGVSAAALNVGLSLSQNQVKDVLSEFYKQPKLAATVPMKKKQQLRLERKYVEALRHDAEKTEKLRNIITTQRRLLQEKDDLIAEAKHSEATAENLLNYGGVQMLSDRVNREQTLAISMSSIRVKELEGKVASIEEDHEAAQTTNAGNLELYNSLKIDYDGLLKDVIYIKQQWQKKEEELRIKENEIEMLQQGRRRDDQLWRARLLETCKAASQCLTMLPQYLLNPLYCEERVKGDVFEGVLELVRVTKKHIPMEGPRIALSVVESILKDDGRCEGGKPFANELVEQLQEKVEMLATENRSKFREIRYMKHTLQYSCKHIDDLIAGTSPPPPDKSQPFPPPDIVHLDKDYAYAWIDERKLLEEALSNLNLFVRFGGTKPNSMTSVISVLGYWKDLQQAEEEELQLQQQQPAPPCEE